MILMSVIRKLTVLSSNSKQWSIFIAFLLNSLIFWLHLGLWHFPQKLIKCVTSIIRTLWHISRLKINKSYVTFIRDLRVDDSVNNMSSTWISLNVSSTDLPTGRSLTVIWRSFPWPSIRKRPRNEMPSSSFNTPYDLGK